jgi:hypothetical protein
MKEVTTVDKRYYLSDIIGDGSDDNPFRPALQDHGVSWAASIPTDDDPNSPNYGKPRFTSCFAIVVTTNHGPLRADSRLEALPDQALTKTMSSIPETAKTGMLIGLSRKGFSTGINVGGTYRDTLQDIGAQRDPGFNIDVFDVIG